MEYIKHFLENNIVINWLAPVVTTVLATIILRILSIGKKRKKINEANKKYIDAIRPYVIKKQKIGDDILNSLRSAVSIETGIAEKDLYSVEMLKDVLIYIVSTTQFMEEQEKIGTVEYIIENFSGVNTKQLNDAKKRMLRKRRLCIVMISGIVFFLGSMGMYFANPERAEDPNSIYAGLIIVLFVFAIACFMSFVWAIVGWSSLANSDSDTLAIQIAETINDSFLNLANLFYRKKNKKKNKEEDIQREKDNSAKEDKDAEK